MNTETHLEANDQNPAQKSAGLGVHQTCSAPSDIHVLRNPYGHSDEVVRSARLRAADRLENFGNEFDVRDLKTEIRELKRDRLIFLAMAILIFAGLIATKMGI